MMPPVVLGAGVLGLLAVAHGASRQRHPVLAVIAGALCGMAGLSAVALLAPMTGIRLPLNGMTGFFAAVLGLPGVITLLVLQLLFSV